jgi:hypothetical protein
MKLFVALTILLISLVACGGSSEKPLAANASNSGNAGKTTFDAPPDPGGKR